MIAAGYTTADIASGEVWLYSFNADNRLVKAEHNPSSVGSVDLRVEFGYDVNNNRISTSVDADGDGGGSAIIAKFAYDHNGNAYVDFHGTSTVDARHVFGGGVDNLLASIEGSDVTWYYTDIISSARELSDGSGRPPIANCHLSYSFGSQ